MNGKIFIPGLALVLHVTGCGRTDAPADGHHSNPHGEAHSHVRGSTDVEGVAESVHYAEESHLRNVRQFTYGGDNAEAYWSFGGQQLVFQASNSNWGAECDQIFVMSLDEERTPSSEVPKQVSTGLGRTTCSYFNKVSISISWRSLSSCNSTGSI